MAKRKPAHKKASPPPIIPEKLKELEVHAFLKDTVSNSLIPFMKAKKAADEKQIEFMPNTRQQYDIDVFYYVYCLYDAVKRLYDIPLYTRNNLPFTTLAHHGIGPEDWFDYHYANFRVIATGIYDTALIVTNYLLRIDLPTKDCTDRKISRHPGLVESGLNIPLGELRNSVQKYRDERNLFVHRSERPEVDFTNNLKAYRFLKEAQDKGFYKKKLPTPAMEHLYFQQQKERKCTEMTQEADEICTLISSLFVAWQPIYLQMLKQMEESIS